MTKVQQQLTDSPVDSVLDSDGGGVEVGRRVELCPGWSLGSTNQAEEALSERKHLQSICTGEETLMPGVVIVLEFRHIQV